MGREQLVHEYRRLCITGFRLTTGRGQMAEGRIGATPTRVIMLETLAGIVRRRQVTGTPSSRRKTRRTCELTRFTTRRAEP